MIRIIKECWTFFTFTPFLLLYAMMAIGFVLLGVPGSWIFGIFWLMLMIRPPRALANVLKIVNDWRYGEL